MKQLADERRGRLIFLKRELLKSCVNSKFYHPKLNVYDPPKVKMPLKIKRMMKEIDDLEREIADDRRGSPKGTTAAPMAR